MVQHTNQMSIRIVSVDHYMSKPDPQFDACYSEFRGSEIKQVPVIRLFGSNTEGIHSCVHIHGVFPYFYIPYDGSVADKLVVDQKIYQLACALDKGINVSLGRSASQTKHIFKIVLVKGIPIYGYHRNSHHYFKIYMYNPHLLRNATQLLMNGTILSGTYQVHETHIPYILQFFIDYNLYGMSFLEVNSNGLRQRTNATETVNNIPPKMSTSEYEIDVLAADILNREPEDNNTGEFANPGIASIWKDEQTRRLLVGFEQPERMNLSQTSGSAHEIVTESDRFYRARLLSKLSKEHTPSSTADEQRKVLASAYPSEATEDETLLDASCIVNHTRPRGGHSNESLYDSQISYHFDSTVVDEEKIISMSQNPDMTLGEEDYSMLEILRELEELESNNIEGDCLLAPMTQLSGEKKRSIMQSSLNLSQANKRLNASMYGDLDTVCLMSDQANERTLHPDDASFDSDDEFLLDFSQKQSCVGNNELAETSTLLNDSDDDLLSGGFIPQLDGGDDSFKTISSKRNRSSKESISPNSSSAKKMRIDLTQPLSRKSSRSRVSFALSPEENDSERGKRMLQEFENSSPNTLKNFEIRIPKLGLVKKSILFSNRTRNSSKSTTVGELSIPMKSLQVCIPKLDTTAYDVSQSSAVTKMDSTPKDAEGKSAKLDDRYQLARTYDIVNNYDPLEGPSTPKSERVRRKIVTPAAKGQPKAKMLKFEEEQQIELILSERFKNIVRLSPKVLIKPLLLIAKPAVNSELSLDEYSSPRKILPEDGPPSGKSDVAECNGSSNQSASVAEGSAPSTEPELNSAVATDTACSSDDNTTPKQVETVVEEIATNDEAEKCSNVKATEQMEESEGMDVEFSLPCNSDSGSETARKTGIEDASDKNVPTISIADDDSDDSLPINRVISLEDDVEEDVQMIAPSLLDDLPIADLLSNNSCNAIDVSDDVSETQTVTIASQLDGVGELMDESPSKDPQPEPENSTAADEAGVEDDANIESFCEKTMLCELDDINSDSDDSCPGLWNTTGTEMGEHVIISLAAAPPTRDDAQQAIDKFEIPAVVNTTPFYSDPADVTGKKEVGHTVLNIAGNSLNDEQEFTSTIAGLGSLKHLRYDNLQRTFGENIDDVLGPIGANGPNSERMKELLASEGCVVITPAVLPPDGTEAANWIDNRCRQRQTDVVASIEADSPIKVKTAETIMAVEEKALANHLTPRIDSESSLNLSVLVANEGHTDMTTNGKSPTKPVEAKTETLNSLNTPDHDTSSTKVPSPAKAANTLTSDLNGSSVERDAADEIASSQEERTKRPNANEPDAAEEASNLTEQPVLGTGTTDQSETIEQSNADLSTATPIGFKVDFENLQDAKSKCEI